MAIKSSLFGGEWSGNFWKEELDYILLRMDLNKIDDFSFNKRLFFGKIYDL